MKRNKHNGRTAERNEHLLVVNTQTLTVKKSSFLSLDGLRDKFLVDWLSACKIAGC